MVGGVSRVSGAALLAISLWGASFVATRFVLEVFSPLALVAIRLVLGSVLLVILGRMAGYAVWSVRGGRWIWLVLGSIMAAHLAALAFLGVLCSGVAYLLWFRAVGGIGPARTGSYLYLEPFVKLAVARSVLRRSP
jgi:drug/metabolite transporter (DMT)-like permease